MIGRCCVSAAVIGRCSVAGAVIGRCSVAAAVIGRCSVAGDVIGRCSVAAAVIGRCCAVVRCSDTGRWPGAVHADWSVVVAACHVSLLRLTAADVCRLHCEYVC